MAFDLEFNSKLFPMRAIFLLLLLILCSVSFESRAQKLLFQTEVSGFQLGTPSYTQYNYLSSRKPYLSLLMGYQVGSYMIVSAGIAKCRNYTSDYTGQGTYEVQTKDLCLQGEISFCVSFKGDWGLGINCGIREPMSTRRSYNWHTYSSSYGSSNEVASTLYGEEHRQYYTGLFVSARLKNSQFQLYPISLAYDQWRVTLINLQEQQVFTYPVSYMKYMTIRYALFF